MNIARYLTIPMIAFVTSCTSASKNSMQASFEVSNDAVAPGSEVLVGGKPEKLYPGTLNVGDSFKEKLASYEPKGQVAIINIVPSIDTPVCEAQTHELGESSAIPAQIRRVTISRDLPMAQSRFAKEAKLENIEYVSDYKYGTFGKNSGLLIKNVELLARAVVVVDRKGIIRYVQIVPNVGTLPNLDKAIAVARQYL